jgi:penicillin-binding protein 1A
VEQDPTGERPLEHEPAPARSRPRRRLPSLRGLAASGLRRRWVRWTLPLVLTAVVGIATGVAVGAAIHVPSVEALAEFTPSRITQLFDRSGVPFASYARQRRVVLSQDQIPDRMRNAVIAVEDANFYHHGGLDALSVLRAAWTNFRLGRREEGASTLTMQLARQLFLTPEKKWRRKIREALLAVELEKTYSKQQLLTLYLNFIYLGHGQYGVEAASRFYFGKSVRDLSIAEAATLAGIYQRPSRFSPYRAPEATQARRDHVLSRMREEGFISRRDYEAAVAEPLAVVTHHSHDEVGAYFAEEVRQHLEATFGSTELLEGGLQVATTLDVDVERSAEKALRAGLIRLDRRRGWRGPHERLEGEDLEERTLPSWDGSGAVEDRWFEGLVLESNRTSALVKVDDEVHTLTPEGMAWTDRREPATLLKRGDVAWFRLAPPAKEGGEPILMLEQEPEVEGAAIVLESATGAVRAMVGGWDFSRNQFNRATQARRQAGSAFKLFVYGTAMEAGFTPADTLFDAPVYLLGADNRLSYSPTNYYPTYYGITTLARALEKSYNVTAVKLLDLVGADQVIDFARRAGITSDLPPYPSLALGSADIVPMELAAAYAAIANQGTYVKPYLIERVRTPEGATLEERVPETRSVTSPQVAFVLTSILEGVVDRGTGVAISDLDVDIAGKTGTTNDYSNAWFSGFTPRYTILVWVGYDKVRSLGRGMAGDKAALPIWRDVAVDGLASGWITPGARFTPPPGVDEVAVDYLTGLRATPDSPRTAVYAFLIGTEPVREYTPEWTRIMNLPWYQQRPFYLPKEGERMPADFKGLDVVRTEPAGGG